MAWHYMVAVGLGAVLIVAVAFVADLIARRVLIRVVSVVVGRSATAWDDILSEQGVFARLARIAR